MMNQSPLTRTQGLLPPAFGTGMTTETYDRAALDMVNPRLLKIEKELYGKKWFDYRFMHPVEATYLFAHYYTQAHKSFMSKRIGAERAAFVRGFRSKSGDIFDGKAATYQVFWRGRQEADKLGMPYDYFCDLGMRAADKAKWRHSPRPNQMYGEGMIYNIVSLYLEDVVKPKILNPVLPFYRAEHYEGHPYQNDWLDWLAEQIMMRPNPEYGLMNSMFVAEVIDREQATNRLPEDLIIRAEQLWKKM